MGGVELAKVQVPFEAACCNACDAIGNCSGFAYLKPHCYLKRNLLGTYNGTSHVSTRLRLVRGDCSGFGALQEDVDLVGHLLLKRFAPSESSCCNECTSTAKCQGFSFFRQFCYLKGDVSGVYSRPGCVVRKRQLP
ncbi:MAG: PAN domain-containing protein [Candidatus Fonsibacter sp.]